MSKHNNGPSGLTGQQSSSVPMSPASPSPIQVIIGPSGENVVIQVISTIILPKVGAEDFIAKLRSSIEATNSIIIPMADMIPTCRH